MLGETAADLLEPWPVTIVVDSVLGGKKAPAALSGFINSVFGTNTTAILEFALAAVLVIAIVGASAPTSKSI